MAKKQSEISPDLGLGPAHENPTQSRTVGNFLKSSDYDTIVAAEQTMTQHGHNPATSEKQARFMRACAHGFTPSRSKCPSKGVAREFMHTKKG